MHERGLIVGKFCPLHAGHQYLISKAQEQCKQLYILSYTSPEFDGCEPEKRRKWLKHAAPKAQIIVLEQEHEKPHNDAADDIHRKFTADICRKKFGIIPNVVFTSEEYGDGFAQFLSDEFESEVAHVCIDKARTHVPISGSIIRADIYAAKPYLSPWIYANFVKSVCFLGAESTGKSTLSKTLADIFSTNHVEEYGRTLWIEKNGDLTFEDYLKIANTHISLEDATRLFSDQYVFVDTSPLTTLFYALEHYGRADKRLIDLSYRPYDHIFLCHPDFPMVQDGWRSDETFRRRQHEWYVKTLKDRHIAYTDLKGSFEDKVDQIKNQLSLPPAPA